jgi:hypothetical protein
LVKVEAQTSNYSSRGVAPLAERRPAIALPLSALKADIYGSEGSSAGVTSSRPGRQPTHSKIKNQKRKERQRCDERKTL